MGGELVERDAIRRILGREGPQSLHGLAQHVGVHHRRIQSVLAELTRQDIVHSVRVGWGLRYLWKTPEIRACTCDGTCLLQVVALRDRRGQALWDLLPPQDCIGALNLVQTAEEELGWSNWTTYKWLKRLVDADLATSVSIVDSDQRMRWYKRLELHPTAASSLKRWQKTSS